jgi:dynein heavy chain
MQADPYETMETTVQQTIQTLTVLFKKLNEEYDDVAQVALKVRGNLEEFREHLPLIKCITSEAITPEDWGFIRDAVGKPEMERDQITVISFGEYDLAAHFEEIEEITFRAEKKFQLQKKLKKLKDDMKN